MIQTTCYELYFNVVVNFDEGYNISLTLRVFFHIRGTRAVETQFQAGNPNPYPVQQQRKDLGAQVVLSTSRFSYTRTTSTFSSTFTHN